MTMKRYDWTDDGMDVDEAGAYVRVDDVLPVLKVASDALEELRRGYGAEVSAKCFPALNLMRDAMDAAKP
jgi:hypothetical protein